MSGGSEDSGLPPPPAAGDGIGEGLSVRVRLVVTAVAVVAASSSLVVWALSFLASLPVRDHWEAVVFPGFFAIFPCWAVVVVDATKRYRGTSFFRSGTPFPLRGWRALAAGVVLVMVWLPAWTGFGDGLSGDVFEEDGRYFVTQRDEVREISEGDYLDDIRRSSRLFSGVVVAFGGIATLYLTSPVRRPGDVGEADDGAGDESGRLTCWRRLAGATEIDARLEAEQAEILTVIQRSIPGVPAARWEQSVLHVECDWDAAVRGYRRSYPVALRGSIGPPRYGRRRVRLWIGPATRRAAFLPLFAVGSGLASVVWLAILVGVNVFPTSFLVIWAALGGPQVLVVATVGWRATRPVVSALRADLAGPEGHDRGVVRRG